MAEPRPVPPITDEMREHARVQPDSWLYVLDPAADPDSAVPPELVMGAFPVDSHGVLGELFEHNPRYVPGRPDPGPTAPTDPTDPTDPLDVALRELAAGRGSREAVLALLRTAELLLQESPGDGAPEDGFVVVATPVGRDVVQAWSSPSQPGAPAGPQRRRGRELARSLPPDVDVQLNPGSAVPITVPRESLLR